METSNEICPETPSGSCGRLSVQSEEGEPLLGHARALESIQKAQDQLVDYTAELRELQKARREQSEAADPFRHSR